MKELQDGYNNLTSTQRNLTDSFVKSRNFRTTIPSATCSFNGQLHGSCYNQVLSNMLSPQVGESFRPLLAQGSALSCSTHYGIMFHNFTQQPKIETNAIVPLQPQKEEAVNGFQRLAAQAQHINQLAAELETAIIEMKAIASILNSQRRHQMYLQGKPFQSVCQYFAVSIPYIKYKSGKSFILTMRKVDLFRADREAALLAKELRQKLPSLIKVNKRINKQKLSSLSWKYLICGAVRHFFRAMLIRKS